MQYLKVFSALYNQQLSEEGVIISFDYGMYVFYVHNKEIV